MPRATRTVATPERRLRRLAAPPALLAPILAVLDGLSIARRIAALVACLLIPGLLTTLSFAATLADDIELAARERRGVQVVSPALQLMIAVAAGGPADPARLEAQLAAHPGLVTDDAHDVLATSLNQYTPLSLQSRVRTLVQLELFITKVSSSGGLGSDPQLITSALLRSMVDHLPAALVATTQAAAPVPIGDSLVGARSVQAGVIASAATAITNDLQATVVSSSDPALAGEVAPLLTAARTLAQLSSSITRRLSTAQDIDNVAALGAVEAAVTQVSTMLDGLLGARVASLRQSSAIAVLVAVLGFSGATWIGIAVLWRTRIDVGQLLNNVQALAAGDRSDHVMPTGGDEFGDIGRALTGARIRLAGADDEIRRQSQERLRLLRLGETRERLLQRLLDVQRMISARQPLQQVLDHIVVSATAVLDEALVALVVVDDDGARPARLAATSGDVDDALAQRLVAAGLAAMDTGSTVVVADLLAAPVLVRDVPTAAMITSTPAPAEGHAAPKIDPTSLLQAFAQQVGLALTDARTAAEVIEARHDPLTGLPNRTLFLSLLDTMLAGAAGDTLTLLFIDLDRFKTVNDSLGHEAGDELLAAVSKRIQGCLHEDHVAARLGGDEFAVAVRGEVVDGGRDIAQRIIGVIREPFVVGGTDVAIGASIGIARRDRDSAPHDAAALLSDADIAMYRAKKSGLSQAMLFQGHMREESRARLRLVADLRAALTARQLHLEYQPVVELATGRVVGAEALARWHHRDRGIVGPGVFIPVAEETGLIADLGRWVLRECLRQHGAWRRSMPDLRLNVNVSGHQLSAPDFPSILLTELRAAGVRADMVTLELTESVLMNDPVNTPRRLAELKDLGFRIAVDDFGTGYSSLAYLRRLPVDDVKIDRAFITGLGDDEKDYAVVSTVLDLARSLQLRAVAEGIETPRQLAALRRLGCSHGQGYLLGRPMLPAQLEAFCRSTAGAPSLAG